MSNRGLEVLALALQVARTLSQLFDVLLDLFHRSLVLQDRHNLLWLHHSLGRRVVVDCFIGLEGTDTEEAFLVAECRLRALGVVVLEELEVGVSVELGQFLASLLQLCVNEVDHILHLLVSLHVHDRVGHVVDDVPDSPRGDVEVVGPELDVVL